MVLRNEFAMVELRLEDDGNGPRLLVRDADTGDSIRLDALEVAALTRMRHEDFGPLVVRDRDA